ncbi:MAG: hypothetical protein IBX55_15920 [Methyloprofundus sp.]|nr:hypothetical protein [Methyloprofundus sp.]
MRVTIQPGQRTTAQIEHRYLRVIFASAPFQVETAGVPEFVLRNKNFVDLEKPRKLVLINLNDQPIQVELQTAPFKISDLDSVELAEGSLVGLVPGTAIDIGEVQMAANAEIAIKSGSTVAINNLPAVQEVQGQVDVTGSVVEIGALPAVTLAHRVKKDTKGTLNGLPMIEFTGNTATVNGNAGRKLLEVVCDISNIGRVWVGTDEAGVGIPLSAGESYSGEVSEVLDLYASVIGDKVYLAELVEV